MGVVYWLSLKVLLSKMENICRRHLCITLLDREEGPGQSPPECLYTKRWVRTSRREKWGDGQEAAYPRERGKLRKEFEEMSNVDLRDDLRFYHVGTAVEPHRGCLRRGRREETQLWKIQEKIH